MIDTIKRIFGRKSKRYPTPYKYGLIDFTGYAKRNGISGDIAKKITVYINKKPVKFYQYSDEVLKVIRKRMPIVDLTEGHSHPKIHIHHTYTPGDLIKAW